MMDYKGIAIPDGVVKKITDSSGNVLWESETKIEFQVLCTAHNMKIYFEVPSGTTWRQAASMGDISSTHSGVKLIITEDVIMGDKVNIEYYYGGARSAVITNAKPEDIIEAKLYMASSQ